MSNEPESGTRSRLANALTWSLVTLLRLVLAIVLLLAITAGIYYGIQELEGRFRSIDRQVDLLQNDANDLTEGQTSQRVHLDELQESVDQHRRQLLGVEEKLAGQQNRLGVLSEEVSTLISGGDAISQSIIALGGGLVALQGDINEDGRRIDELGGQMDQMQAELGVFAVQVEDFEDALTSPDDEISRLHRALALFHLWELVTRARLRLAENNPGLAEVDVERAMSGVSSLIDAAAGEEANILTQVLARLALARDNLPNEPVAAGRDLEGAWEELDRLIVDLVLPGVFPEIVNADEIPAIPLTPGAAAIPTDTATPVSIATPTVAITPTVTISSTVTVTATIATTPAATATEISSTP